MTWLRGKKWIKVWFVTSFQSYFWLKLFSSWFLWLSLSITVNQASLYSPLFDHRDSRIVRRFREFTEAKNQRIYAKEGVLIVALCWILWSFFGGLPFVFSGQIPSLIDAFFEISSGFTTTGASILNDVSVLSRSLLFWRSFTHLIGGMGVLVFALAIMNNAKNSHLEVMKAEVPGPVFGKVVSKLKTLPRSSISFT